MNLKSRTVVFFLGSSLMLATGCGSKSDSSDSSGGTQNIMGQSLIGKWGRPCEDTSSGGTTKSQITSIGFDGTTMTAVTGSYLDASCSQPSMETSISGSYSVGAANASASLAGATDLDYEFTQISIKPQNANVVTAFNTSAYCGYTNWAINVARSMPLTTPCLNSSGTKGLQIFEIKEGKLYYGVDSADPTKRPTALDTEFYQAL